ncbi:hypothetical protein MYCTH_2305890 [Thermothelomyces thermophilus ATCC 42464]|uniref:Uncharacterized protein n=1 Tax=Thermothelomyces thermophilus (strain ATCC 42464 / BCRC 31852 / DSM 1799) TaxID=573729 RepID=G2QG46_THET4|nr:uncharacterized protein MYCTH_2305890 [Thermothelomyces thermophilus ATCC 42464]AEO58511.1 hypothetical protein MYCTH_2305890 [Thermothelomyces thermophilus ATCC 42464]
MGLPTEDLPPPTYTEATTTSLSSSSPSLGRYYGTSSPLSPDATGTTAAATRTITTSGAGGRLVSSPLTHHLRTLPARLRASHLARQTARAALELDLAAVLAARVEGFLARDDVVLRLGSSSSFSSSSVAELTLVPASAVPRGAGLSGAVERRREGEIVRAARVDVVRRLRVLRGFADEKGGDDDDDDDDDEDEDDDGGMLDGANRHRRRRRRRRRFSGAPDPGGNGGDKKGGGGGGGGGSLRQEIVTEFGDWGRFDSSEGVEGGGGGGESWWFGDEDMARRLAAYLRPEPDLERKRVQASVAENRTAAPSKEEKPSGWARWGLGVGGGRKKAAERASSGPLPSPVSPVNPASGPGPAAAAVGEDDAITMAVRAEEVTFRWENDFGLWESKTGWGIVVTLTMQP